MFSRRATIAGLSVLGLFAASAARASEIVVLSTTSAKEALIELAPLFERSSGAKVRVDYSPGSALGERIRSGATADLLIAPAEFTDPLLKDGEIVPGSRVDFARSGASLAIRAGAAKPDIGSPEAFKKVLIDAKTIAYSRGTSGLQFLEAVAQLGIADLVKQKTVMPAPGELVGAVVAGGAAEVGVQQLSELLPVRGIEIVGALPAELQKDIIYGASRFPDSRAADTARAFAEFLKSATARAVLRKYGLDPIQ